MQIADALAAAHEQGHRAPRPQAGQRDGDAPTAASRCSTSAWRRAAAGASRRERRWTRRPRRDRRAASSWARRPTCRPSRRQGGAIDHRTDIFSLGVVLYEMASGGRPFEGATSVELASAILRDAPRPLTEIRSDVPADLGRLIRRCLEKDVQRRVQTARDVGNELRDIAAILGAANAHCFGAGAREQARERGIRRRRFLGGRAAVQVHRRQSGCRRARRGVIGRDRDRAVEVLVPQGDGARCHQKVTARYVMDGSLRQAGSQLRLAVQLVDADDRRSLVGGNI